MAQARGRHGSEIVPNDPICGRMCALVAEAARTRPAAWLEPRAAATVGHLAAGRGL